MVPLSMGRMNSVCEQGEWSRTWRSSPGWNSYNTPRKLASQQLGLSSDVGLSSRRSPAPVPETGGAEQARHCRQN